MTEQEWITSNDPQAMLEVLTHGPAARAGRSNKPPPSNRKLRLFACACCHQVWEQLTDPRSRRAVEMGESRADGDHEPLWFHAWVDGANAYAEDNSFEAELASRCCGHIVELLMNSGLPRWFSVSTKFAAAQAALLRDLFGNPWKQVAVDAARPTPTVLDLARAAYEERLDTVCAVCVGIGRERIGVKFGKEKIVLPTEKDCLSCHGKGRIETGHLDPARLAVLADALEEAGCREEALLRHLRGQEQCSRCLSVVTKWAGNQPDPANCWECKGLGWIPLRGPHVPGCWALDLVLGKE